MPARVYQHIHTHTHKRINFLLSLSGFLSLFFPFMQVLAPTQRRAQQGIEKMFLQQSCSINVTARFGFGPSCLLYSFLLLSLGGVCECVLAHDCGCVSASASVHVCVFKRGDELGPCACPSLPHWAPPAALVSPSTSSRLSSSPVISRHRLSSLTNRQMLKTHLVPQRALPTNMCTGMKQGQRVQNHLERVKSSTPSGCDVILCVHSMYVLYVTVCIYLWVPVTCTVRMIWHCLYCSMRCLVLRVTCQRLNQLMREMLNYGH